MRKNYTIGLDIGTNSVGYSVVYDDYTVPTKKMKVLGNTNKKSIKKNLIGALLFDSGETAQGRRVKRTNRRRITRRVNRIKMLQEIFFEEMNKIDESFFYRLTESFLVSDDKKYSKYPVFSSKEDEKNYNKKYPTIYHLRKELVDSKEKFDLRLVYLAIAHTIKYRGHFLYEGNFNVENISVEKQFAEFVDKYNELFSEKENLLPVDKNKESAQVLEESISKTRKVEKVSEILGEKKNSTASQFLKLMVGNTVSFKKIYDLEEDVKLQISADDYEQKLEELVGIIGDEYLDLFISIKNTYDSIILSGILVDNGDVTQAKLSNSMIIRFEDHQTDLKKIKQFFLENIENKYEEMFKDKTKDGYAGYIHGKASETQFYDYLKKILKNNPNEYFMQKIENGTLLRKQRTYDNGSIPHQIHLGELSLILENQAKHYPFLKDNKEKIEQILKFRIPYYVGPLARGNSNFAWLKRNSDKKITPWNIEQVVNYSESAQNFIERMTLNDVYLPNEKVLPKHSLIYEQYMIFNEITKISYVYGDNDKHKNFLSTEQKREIFEKLFKVKRKITKKNIEDFLSLEYGIECARIEGIDKEVNSKYGTYLDLCKIKGMKELIDSDKYEKEIEGIIKTLTLFEDKKMLKEQLSKYNYILTDKMIKDLSGKKYTGWGRLSNRLINGIRDKNSKKTILEYLKDDKKNRNLMQLITDDSLSFEETINNESKIDVDKDFKSIVDELAGSPAIKKGILQSIKIVEELVKVMGYQPSNIVVEMARENQTTAKGKGNSKSRYKKLEDRIKKLGSNILKEQPTNNEALQNDRLYLYYLQNGQDMYTNAALDINLLSSYDVDHIIPRSFIVDNSIDNIVLTSSKSNRGKSDSTPSQDVINNRQGFWRRLHKYGLISDRKLNNLMKAQDKGLTEGDKERFIKRQLVETRQITKNVVKILDEMFNKNKEKNEKTRIITLKSAMTSRFRKEFGYHKVREINNRHHAHDAYLNCVVALSILKVYPSLSPYFVYGEFNYSKMKSENKATERKNFFTNITKFMNKDSSIKIIDEDTGEVFWDREYVEKVVEKVLYSSQVNIVKKTEEQKGRLYKETINTKGESDKLIPVKSNLDPKKYGGFIEPTVAYTVLVRRNKGNKIIKELLGITVSDKDVFEKDFNTYLESKGYLKEKKIIKFPKYTIFKFDDGKTRLLASATEFQKGNELVLSKKYVDLLNDAKIFDKFDFERSKNEKTPLERLEENRELFGELLNIISDFNSHTINADKNMNKIKTIYEKNKDTDIKEIAKSFINLLTFTNSGASASFKFFEENVDRKRYLLSKEYLNATVIFKSRTGLYETWLDLREKDNGVENGNS